jgi:flagellar motor switch/type III secretory pathway protein FliN
MQTAQRSRPTSYRFEGLPSLTHEEVLLWNWYCHVGPSQVEWTSWLAEICGRLFERPAGQQLQLVQTHLVDTQFGEKVLSFGSKQELVIGRADDNDVVLSAQAIASQHARLAWKDGQLHLQDLAGRLGTYLWDEKIQPNETRRLKNGDQFTVFPYRFRVVLEQCWSPETDVALSECRVQPVSRAGFFQASPAGWIVFVINAHPGQERALLEVSPSFLSKLQQGMLGPLGLEQPAIRVPSDDALLGFTVLAVLEHLNRRLKFPVQFSLGKGTRSSLADATRGIFLSFAVGVGGLTGHFRIFLPMEFLSQCKPDRGGESGQDYPAGLGWSFPVSAGFVDLSPEEMAQIGLGDVLVVQQAPAVLFPADFSRGWRLVEEGSNFARFRVDKYFERSIPVEAGSEPAAAASKPNLATLPLRVHVVLGEKEFTLEEVTSLSPGTIIELEAGKSDPVRLMVNGRILGDGELVDVDGKLAVRVLRWRSSG